jgi:H+/Cl- antiporter ClcA
MPASVGPHRDRWRSVSPHLGLPGAEPAQEQQQKASIYVLLLAIGIASSVTGKLVDFLAEALLQTRASMLSSLTGSMWQRYVTWVGWTLSLTLLSVFITLRVCPHAKGSGIPQMKSVLAGGVMSADFLSVRCLLTKAFGLTAALAAGLSIGKEGPWVHFSAIVANVISRLGMFRHLATSKLQWQQVLSAGFAAGTAANFGAPMGGVLFSIEVTATHYLARNYYPAFFCAWSGAFGFRLLNMYTYGKQHDHALYSHAGHFAYDRAELLAFACLGIIAGLLGAAFVELHRRLVEWQRVHCGTVASMLFGSSYAWAGAVAVLTATMSFPSVVGDFMALSDGRLVNDLFSHHELDDPEHIHSRNSLHWSGDLSHGRGVLFSLCCVVVVRFLLTISSISLPLPCGLYSPVFVIGCALGRIFGNGVVFLFPDGLGGGEHIMRGGYAVVGAAAFSAGVTRTVSSAVFVFELTGSLHNLLPVLTAVILSIGVGNFFTPGIYDSLLDINRLPYFYNAFTSPALQARGVEWHRPRGATAADVMQTHVGAVPVEVDMGTLDDLVQANKGSIAELAIVSDSVSMLLAGSIRIVDAVALVSAAKQADGERWRDARLLLTSEQLKHVVRTPFSILDSVGALVLERYFSMLGLEAIFVTRLGRVIGVITKQTMMAHPSVINSKLDVATRHRSWSARVLST